MLYRKMGNTGLSASVLGLGCMRLPMTMRDGKKVVDDELATPLIRRAYDLGVNYFDTAWGYCEGDSQRATGKALKDVRDKVLIATKLPMWDVHDPEDFWKYLMGSLERLDTDWIDFYHFHGLDKEKLHDQVLPYKLIDKAEKAKAKGLIKHLSFSFHDVPEIMKEIIDTGAFSSVLCQYNLIDRRNAEMIHYAADKGLGVVIMGPVGGGILSHGGKEFLEKMGSGCESTAEMALRFVWGNPDVSVALSGMGEISQIEENCRWADKSDDIAEIKDLMSSAEELTKLNDPYCSGCNYCAICPQKILPGNLFDLYNKHNVWGLTGIVKERFAEIGTNPWSGARPDECTNCGTCLSHCPQKIDIPEELKRITAALSAL